MELVEKLWARELIRERLGTYCKAVDTKDWSLLRSCFGEGHQHKHGSYEGDADGFVEFVRSKFGNLEISQHALSNVSISIAPDGLRATSEANFSSVHRFDADEESEAYDWLVEGTYSDELVCDNGVWLIVKRVGKSLWQRRMPIADT